MLRKGLPVNTGYVMGFALNTILLLAAASCTNVQPTTLRTPSPSHVTLAARTNTPLHELTPSEAPLTIPTDSTPSQDRKHTPTPSWSAASLDHGLYVVSMTSRGLLVRDLQGSEVGEVPSVYDPAASLSSDGLKIAYRAAGWSAVKLLDLDRLSESEVGRGSNLEFGGGSWAPDGLFIVFDGVEIEPVSGEDWSSLYLIDIPSDTITRLTFWWTAEVTPAWSPDGRWIAYASAHHFEHPGEKDLYVYDLNCVNHPEECA